MEHTHTTNPTTSHVFTVPSDTARRIEHQEKISAKMVLTAVQMVNFSFHEKITTTRDRRVIL
jgi:hypothetical protein